LIDAPVSVTVSVPARDPKAEGRDMSLVTSLIASFSRDDEEGQGLAEYALILALIAIIAIVALIFLGNQVSGILSKVGNSI
jgi:pilus assembly protein Flp/PilA